MERSHLLLSLKRYLLLRLNTFPGLLNVLTGTWVSSDCHTSHVSIPFRDYGTFSRYRGFAFNWYACCFNPFQGLWNVLTSTAWAGTGWLLCFNPFQGLWNVLTSPDLPSQISDVSIFQDYGITFIDAVSLKLRMFNPFRIMERSHHSAKRRNDYPNWVSPLSGIMERSHGCFISVPRLAAVSIPFRDYGTFSRTKGSRGLAGWACFNPSGLWNVHRHRFDVFMTRRVSILRIMNVHARLRTAKTSSISVSPFRDYGTSRKRIWWLLKRRDVSIPFRDYGTFSLQQDRPRVPHK